jgi:hypothetical protein
MPAALDDDHWSSRAVPECYRTLAVQGGMKMGGEATRAPLLAMGVPRFRYGLARLAPALLYSLRSSRTLRGAARRDDP